ncbi:hypothetical protein ZYGR_0AM00150 [Zygosaccharomyces rouxii]|uniref:Uncharacterized protein n=1 Tax=Zygosaccharomyces rouxii TaxID=4956 RepID=A0A1Q3AFH8_ZYGRO|nr:hypothetical protein ZYGR_0AM00150 [Zygosaccharomyces rouxii]
MVDNLGMEPDIETQPLLGSSPSREAVQRDRNTSRRYYTLGVLSIFILLILGVFLWKPILSSQDVVGNAVQVSNVQISKVHLDGWNSEGNQLQLTTNLDFWVNYEDWMAGNKSQMSPWQKGLSRFASEKLVRTACFTLNNVTNYDQNGTVAYVAVKEPICIDLRQGHVTPLQLTVLVEPRIKNIVKVIKKLALHQYDDLQLSSKVDVTFGKRVSILRIPLGRIKNLNINWNQMQSYLRSATELLDSLLAMAKGFSIQDFIMKDSESGFSFDLIPDPLSIPKSFDWFEWPVDFQIPQISWQVKLPDCSGECTIEIPSLTCLNDAVMVEDPLKLSAFIDVEGPLPENFLTQVCWSDEENAVTPITNFLNTMLNASQMVNILIKGHPIPTSHDNDDNFFIPAETLKILLEEMSFFPLAANLTLDSKDSLREVTIDGLRIKWTAGGHRLVVAGKIVAFVALPFYKTNGQHLTVDHIKGTTKLFHDGIQFLAVPMRVWTPSSSKILHDEKNQTVLKLLLDIHDDEVQVTNSMELTRVFNEIFVRGYAEVQVSAKLDLLVTTPLGELVLLGLKGQGKAIVRS